MTNKFYDETATCYEIIWKDSGDSSEFYNDQSVFGIQRRKENKNYLRNEECIGGGEYRRIYS